MRGSDIFLSVRDLWKTYAVPHGGGSRPVLRGLDFCLERGEMAGLVGESGSGKSTLARLLLGLERPDRGTVLLEGQPLRQWLAGKVAAHEASYTHPEEVEEFVSKTGCDSLAIAIGTSHGAYKFKPEQCTVNEQGILVPPPLRFDVLKEVSKRLPGFPIVLHGSSSVPQEYVKMINEHGGKMPNAIGVPEDQLREAAKLSVCKINIDSDLRLAMTGTVRAFLDEHPDKFDPREYLKPARANIKELVRHKLVDVLGCAGKA